VAGYLTKRLQLPGANVWQGGRWLVRVVSLVNRALTRRAAGAESPATEPQRR
jgi:hypothetical protein